MTYYTYTVNFITNYFTDVKNVENIQVILTPETYEYKQDEIADLIKWLDRNKWNKVDTTTTSDDEDDEDSEKEFESVLESATVIGKRIVLDQEVEDGKSEVYTKILENLQNYCDQRGLDINSILSYGLAENIQRSTGYYIIGNYGDNGTGAASGGSVGSITDTGDVSGDLNSLSYDSNGMSSELDASLKSASAAVHGSGLHSGDGKLWCTTGTCGRFYQVYGKACNHGNGNKMAANIVAAYPDEFTLSDTPCAGSVASSGSEISTCGHTWFVDAVNYVYNDDGSINYEATTITYTESNFGKGFRARHIINQSYAEYRKTHEGYIGGMSTVYAVPITASSSSD